jgi:SPP1 family predicted phage head-tail adaptor
MNAPQSQPTNIGRVRHRAILEAKTLTADGGGGFAETWEPYALVWGELVPASGDESVQAGRVESRVSHKLIVRRRTDVSANHRVRVGERTFAITAVVDEGPQAFWMTLLCEEGAPS